MLLVCGWCTTKFAVGVEHCPQCGNADYYPEGTMAKITKHGGPSQVGAVLAAVVGAAAESEKEEPAFVGEQGPEEFPGDLAPLVGEGPFVVVPAELDAGVEPPSVYDTWLLADLREECRRRELATSGNKPELVARLIEHDAAKEPAVEDDPAF